MSSPLRNSSKIAISSNNRTFFVTASTSGKRSIFVKDAAAKLFVKTLFEYRNAGRYRLHEFVLMPDHFHLLLTLGREISIEKAVQLVKGGFSFRAAKQDVLKGEIWQKGFSEIRVSDYGQFSSAQKYIHLNPVRRGLVKVAGKYLFSSAFPGYRLDETPQGLKPTPL